MPRFRLWALTALFAALASMAAPIVAQDAKDKPAEKPAEKAVTADGGPVSFEWKFEKGKKFFQEMTTKTTQNMKVAGADQKGAGTDVKQEQEQTFTFSWELTDEDANQNRTLVLKIEGVKLKVEIGGTPITFDSSNTSSASTALAEFFKLLVGAEFKVTVDKAWKVTKVDGREEFVRKLGQASPQVEPLLKQVLSEEAIKEMSDPTMGLTTPKPVNKGESWTRDTKLNLGPIGNYKNVYKYTLEGVENGIAKVKVESTLTYEPPTEAGAGLPFRIKSAKLQSKDSVGTVLFDTKKGRLERQELKVHLEGPLEIEMSGIATTVELKQDQVTTVTVRDTLKTN